MSREAWVADESGFVSEITGFTITDAFFQTEERYNSGQTPLLHWIGRDAEGKVYGQGDFHPSWPCPNGWVTMDGGKTIVHPGNKGLHSSSLLGKLVVAISEITQGISPDPLANIAPPTDSGAFVGMTFDMSEVELDFGPAVGTKRRLMPVRFVAKGGAAAPATPGAAAPAAAAGGDLEAQVRALAAAFPTFEEFQAAALAIPGVTTNAALLAQIVDRTQGIYAQKG